MSGLKRFATEVGHHCSLFACFPFFLLCSLSLSPFPLFLRFFLFIQALALMSALLSNGNALVQKSFLDYCIKSNDIAFFKGVDERIETAKVCIYFCVFICV